MRSFSWTALAFLLVLLAAFPVPAGQKVLFREQFENLDNWKPFFFPKIPKHSQYAIVQQDGRSLLRTESNGSASAIVYRDPFPVYEFRRLTWRWKVEDVYRTADVRTKAGDDYPLRVYVLFEFDPREAGLLDRLFYAARRSASGEYPPHSTLSYVWASQETADTFITSPYTDRAMMVLLQKGARNSGTWQDESVDIVEDYQRAFGKMPPSRARIAIMNDSDNTGEHAVSYLQYFEVSN